MNFSLAPHSFSPIYSFHSCIVFFLSVVGDEIRRILLESVMPFLKEAFLVKANRVKHSGHDHILVEYDLYDDYLEMVIQFGVSI